MAYQIDDITAIQTPDPLPENAVSQPGYFTDGDPSDKGLGATFVPAWWLNMVQGELLAICQEANIKPDKTNNSQVVASILALVRQQSSNLLSSFEASINSESQRAQNAEAGLQPRGPYVPSFPREGHNDSQINNVFYDNNNAGNAVLSVVGKGLIYLQSADDYALNSRLNSVINMLLAAIDTERNRALGVENIMVPTQPRSGHNDSAINNVFYDNNNGGNAVLSVIGKGLIYLQAANDYALNSTLSSATNMLLAAITSERDRAVGVENIMVPTQPRSGHNDGSINNLVFDRDSGNLAFSVPGVGFLEAQNADNYARVRGTSQKTATQNFFVKTSGNVFGVNFPEPFSASDPKTQIIIQATPARMQGGTAETSTPYVYWNSVTNTGFGLDCSQNPDDVVGYYISATGPIA